MFKNNSKKIKEKEIIDFLENKFSKIDKSLENKIFDIMKTKKVMVLQNLDYGIQNINTQYLCEKQKLDKLLEKKEHLHIYLQNCKSEYLKELEKNVNPELLCQICYENRINLVLLPCGHTFCSKCLNDTVTQCFNCRSNIEKRTKIYNN